MQIINSYALFRIKLRVFICIKLWAWDFPASRLFASGQTHRDQIDEYEVVQVVISYVQFDTASALWVDELDTRFNARSKV